MITEPTTQSYAGKIASTWQKAALSIIEAGQYLLEAEDHLAPDQYRALTLHLVEEVGMSASTISKLRRIALNPVLTSPDNVPKLPPSYATLYRMAQVEETQLQAAFEDDTISTDTQLKEVETAFFKKPKKTKPSITPPTVTITFRGDLSNVSGERLQALRVAMDDLKFDMQVNVKERPQ